MRTPSSNKRTRTTSYHPMYVRLYYLSGTRCRAFWFIDCRAAATKWPYLIIVSSAVAESIADSFGREGTGGTSPRVVSSMLPSVIVAPDTSAVTCWRALEMDLSTWSHKKRAVKTSIELPGFTFSHRIFGQMTE